jgi:predicted dehydrogenase
MDRRELLKAGAAGVAWSSLAAGWSLYAAEPVQKTKRYGLIGCGWYGKSAMFRLLQVAPVEVVALCDVDSKMLAEAAEMVAARQASKNKPRTYGDYREMLKAEQLDIVHVATPDHWHALAMIAAVKAGADVYVEKPISVDVVEGRAMVAAARKYNRVVQVNMQRRSTPHLVEAREKVIKEGRLGKVAYVEICCYYHMRARGNPPDATPPENLNYDMWTGPAPMRPYCSINHPRGWRAFMEYGNGIVGDMCVHMLDMIRWLLDLGWPNRISSTGGILLDKASKANITDTQTATFDFGDIPIIWTHRTWGSAPDPEYPWAAFIYGQNGTLKADVHKYEFIPSGKGEKISGKALYEYDKYPEDQTEKDLERHVASAMRWHWKNFLEMVETRGRPVSDIEQGYITAASCILANISCQLGRTLVWDPQKAQVVSDEEANRLLARPYRQPWIHPEPEKV